MDRETVYRDRANGRWEYWTYCDGGRVAVSAAWVERELARGRIRIVCT